MNRLNYELINKYIENELIEPFYLKRIDKLAKLSLLDILKRKNPYLFKAKNIETSGEFIKYILDSYLSSQ